MVRYYIQNSVTHKLTSIQVSFYIHKKQTWEGQKRRICMKKILSHIFVDGINGMALGIFCTYAFGIILQQLGSLITKDIGDFLITIGGLAIMLTGAGIAMGMASKFASPPLVALGGMLSGMVGAHADAIFESSIVSKVGGMVKLSGAGNPLGAFIAAYVALEVGQLILGKTQYDLLLIPLVGGGCGTITGLFLAPGFDVINTRLADAFQWATKQNNIVMGIVIACLSCMLSLLPISVLSIVSIAKLKGLAAGAATIGCCCSMIGYAVASYHDNKFVGLFAQGIGTAKLQLANTLKRPYILLPSLISSAILGGASGFLKFTNTAKGAAMGTTGLTGCLTAYDTIKNNIGASEALLLVSLLCFVLPGVISLGIAEGMKKLGILKEGEMKIEL